MLMTFRSGQQALEALQFDQRVVGDHPIQVSLKTPSWQKQVEDEMHLARSLSVTLANVTSNSLLGEDFSFSTMSFDMDGKEITCTNQTFKFFTSMAWSDGQQV